MIDVLHVVVLLQQVQHLLDLQDGIRIGNGHGVLRNLGNLSGEEGDSLLFQVLPDSAEVVGGGHDLEDIVIHLHVLGAGFQGDHHHLVLVAAGLPLNHEHAAFIKHETDGAGGAQVSAVLGEAVAHVAGGAVFTKIGREIAIAVREGGANPESNGKLRDIIAKAKANNMPNDNIQRSIKKASGELSNVVYEEITYEGYAPGGVAVIVDCISDNRNRTASDVRHCFAKYGGNLGTTGSVGFMFDERGVLVVEREPGSDEDEMMMIALEAGAEDVKVDDDVFEIVTAPNDFSTVRENLEQQGISFLSAEVAKIPQNTVAVSDPDTVLKIQKMLDLLEENDDVQNVYHNADLPEEEEDE